MTTLMRNACLALLVVTVATSASAQNHELDADSTKGWSLSFGPVFRGGMELRVSGSSYSQQQGLDARLTYGDGIGDIGPTGSLADRTYDDGFVFMDALTWLDGLTTYWGYNSASQYDAPADQLIFTRGGERVLTDGLTDGPMSAEDDLHAWGIGIAVSRHLNAQNNSPVLCGGVNAFQLEDISLRVSNYGAQYTSVPYTVTDRFDIYAALPPPPAPYAGDYDSSGHLIYNTPASRGAMAGSPFPWSAANTVTFNVDSELYEFWFGARFDLARRGKVTAFVLPNVSLNYFTADVTRLETYAATRHGTTTPLASWSDSGGGSDWLFGIGVAFGIEVRLNATWFMVVSAEYDHVFSEAEIMIGPNTIEVDVSGYTASLLFGTDL